MSRRRHNAPSLPMDDTLFAVKQRKPVPHKFVLDAIGTLAPRTRPMFGCLAVYVADKIVLILRDKRDGTADNGVWLATTEEHHESLRREFPNMRSIQAFGTEVTGWQVLPADATDFEEAALRSWSSPGTVESARCRERGGPRRRGPGRRRHRRGGREQESYRDLIAGPSGQLAIQSPIWRGSGDWRPSCRSAPGDRRVESCPVRRRHDG